ncbi:isoprenyl transferase [Nocardiopsis lambiniae]|uniref:Isoprenyl transferase n=1 Tax=Nocardiopsis lambiniae TaxID=3075539 RepID=A0ABU2M715_9ACTN|nr:isoprenyl transferase [Nocardiopsis sp. DSM 44743]MDT0327935.1 isoprenyl transferase [Nocardiopsis sp. DSM 44743]
MGLRDPLYWLYERRLERRLRGRQIPRHVGVAMDGNRRWAKNSGLAEAAEGHRAGADKIFELLRWCDEVGVQVVTLWMLSTDNMSRDEAELDALVQIIEETIARLREEGWNTRPVGALDVLPASTARALKEAEEATSDNPGLVVNVAVGYGGRREIADAVRSLLHEEAAKGTGIQELAERLDISDIARHLYTRGQPDPDLLIRTSGEQRLSGFMLWQSVHSEFYFCEVFWPAFRRVDFLRALRSYGARSRRYGS